MRIAERFAGHTPGPWCVMPEEADKPYIRVRGTRLGERYKIANALGGENELEANEAQANARLIAEAPRHLTLLEQAEAALEEADKRLCALTPRFPPDVGPDMRDVKSIEETGAVVMQIRALLAKLREGGE